MYENNTQEEEIIENIRVSVRVRPLSIKEQANNDHDIVLIDKNQNLIVLNNGKSVPSQFKFDYVFGQNSTEIDIFERTILPIIEDCLDGCNGAVVVYGQAGSGKTFTMTGAIIPYTFHYLFGRIEQFDKDRKFTISISYLEIYNEELHDLLAVEPNKKLLETDQTNHGVFVDNLEPIIIDSVKLINDLFISGNENRITTKSHTILIISIESNFDKTRILSKLHLVDLAGYEHFQGNGNTDISLSVLDNVMFSLADPDNKAIPYQKSKLTGLLQDSFGGNSKTLMIATISPSDYCYNHSLRTLEYMNKVKKIENHIRMNIDNQSLKKYGKNVKQSLKWQQLFETIDIEIIKLKKRISIMKINLLKRKKQNFDKHREKLANKLQRKSEENLCIEQNCLNLQEEGIKISAEIAKIENDITEINGKLMYEKEEHERDIDYLKNLNHYLLRRIKLITIMNDYYIPNKYLKIINNNIEGDHLINDEFVGNKIMKKQRKQGTKSMNVDVQSIYGNYSKIIENKFDNETF